MKLHELRPSDEDLAQMRVDMGVPDDWDYRDMPKATVSAYDMTMDIIGTQNYKLLTVARYPHKQEGELIRSQFLISPTGHQNLLTFIENQK